MSKTKRWAITARQELIEYVHLFKTGSVLDLGGSDGVNDIYLAQQGFEITNIDKDASAIEDFLTEAQDLGLRVKGEVADLNEFEIGNSYDNVISFFTLHFLDRDNAVKLLNMIMDKTIDGGINMLIGFTDIGEFEVEKKHPHKFYPKDSELLSMYRSKRFEIIVHKRSIGPTKSGMQQERYVLIARKTDS